jgi:hypothetical protein
MELPGAYICHQSPQRLRIKITSRKGDTAYFEKLQSTLARFQTFSSLEANALTGSVLIVDEDVDAEGIVNYAKTRHLFDLTAQNNSRSPMTTQLVSRLENLNTTIRSLTTGEMDLAGILLLLLLISGIGELLRGNIRMPPWYTAFWYAFGIYKLASVITEKSSEEI